MEIGFDTDTSGRAVCSAKIWDRTCAGILLSGVGSEPSPYAVLPEALTMALAHTERSLQEQLEQIYTATGGRDFQYAFTTIADCLRSCNDWIYNLSTGIGQGIYLGGCIALCCEGSCMIVKFGGGCGYSYCGNQLIQQGSPYPADGVIRDALGGRKTIKFQCWQGQLPQNGGLILSSDPLPVTDMKPYLQKDSHKNTTAMLLRRELAKTRRQPTAVLQIRAKEMNQDE